MCRSNSVTRQSNLDIPFLFTLPAGALKRHPPLTERHTRILLLSAWGYSRDSLAKACDVLPETMRALLARIHRRAEALLASDAFAGTHRRLEPFRWRVDVGGQDRNSWRTDAMWRAVACKRVSNHLTEPNEPDRVRACPEVTAD